MEISQKLYEDFTTKVLPRVAEWFAMTKDYTFELWWRYIKYLIIMDALGILLWIIFLIASYKIFFFVKEIIERWKIEEKRDEADPSWFFMFMLPIVLWIFWFAWFINNVDLFVKDLLIPEIRIYQELKLTK